MPLIPRPYTYTAGTVIDPAQVTSNETPLYNDYNGNIDADNISSLAENVIVFAASGHARSGGAGGAPIQLVQGTNIASASSLTIPTDGNVFLITGSTGVTALSTRNSGVTVFLRFQAGLTLTHNGTSLILQDARNLVVQANDVIAFYSLGSGNWLQITRKPGRTDRRIAGLTLSNNGTDPTNDIDIAAGWTRSGDDLDDLVLAAALTKQLDAAWAVGTGSGGLDTGAIANTTYHVFVIQNPTAGVVDAIFSTSATAPTMPSGYTKKRRIGSIVRASRAILLFTQTAKHFVLTTPVLDGSAVAVNTTAVLQVMSVPLGIKVMWHGHVRYEPGANELLYVSSPDATDAAPSATLAPLSTFGGISSDSVQRLSIRTDTSGQIRFRANAAGSAYIATVGWEDITL